jgi:hypothetical protein
VVGDAVFWWLVLAVALGVVAIVPVVLASMANGVTPDPVSLTDKGELLGPAIALYLGGSITLYRKRGGRATRAQGVIFGLGLILAVIAAVNLGLLYPHEPGPKAGELCWRLYVGAVLLSCVSVIISEI